MVSDRRGHTSPVLSKMLPETAPRCTPAAHPGPGQTFVSSHIYILTGFSLLFPLATQGKGKPTLASWPTFPLLGLDGEHSRKPHVNTEEFLRKQWSCQGESVATDTKTITQISASN